MLWPRVRSYRCYDPVRPTYDVMTQFGRLMMLWSSSADLWCYDWRFEAFIDVMTLLKTFWMLWVNFEQFVMLWSSSILDWMLCLLRSCYDPVRCISGCYDAVRFISPLSGSLDVMIPVRFSSFTFGCYDPVQNILDVMIQFSSKRFGCYDPVSCGCYDPVQISCGCWVSVGN